MTKDHFLENRYATKWPLCADVPLSPHSFIHSDGVMYVSSLGAWFALPCITMGLSHTSQLLWGLSITNQSAHVVFLDPLGSPGSIPFSQGHRVHHK